MINKQRETIYAERDKVLRNEDLTETIRAFLDEDLEEIVERHMGDANEAATEEGLTDLLVDLGRMGLGGDRIDHDELLKLRSAGAISEHVREVADALLESKEAEVGAEGWATIERFVLLRTIDSLWVEHLTELDDMRRGIGLRGYAQQDPLNEFKKEAFRLYEELSGFIRHQVASTIFRVTLQPQPQPSSGVFAMPGPGQAAPGSRARRDAAGSRDHGHRLAAASARWPAPACHGHVRAGNDGRGGRFRGAGQQARPGYTPSGAKIGRNDACWCGSGRKYKKCHGA